MFESDFIDFFSRVPWVAVPIIYLPAISTFAWLGVFHHGVSIPVAIGQFAFGWFAWSLMEYWLHRTLFHWVPSASWGERFHFLLHGVHHKWHQDRYRLVMPPAASIALGVVVVGLLFGIAALLSGLLATTWVYVAFAGIMAGYVHYDLTHYYVHHAKPRSAYMKRLRAHHMAHHHNNLYKELKFGVSMTLWDHVFGTHEVEGGKAVHRRG